MTLTLILSLLTLNLSPLEPVPVNTQKSTIEWEGGSATTTHNGLINLKSGTLEILYVLRNVLLTAHARRLSVVLCKMSRFDVSCV